MMKSKMWFSLIVCMFVSMFVACGSPTMDGKTRALTPVPGGSSDATRGDLFRLNSNGKKGNSPRRLSPPTAKTCTKNSTCSSTEYCKINACGIFEGTCTKKPTFCAVMIGAWERVESACDCDGNRYASACFAAKQGVNASSNNCP